MISTPCAASSRNGLSPSDVSLDSTCVTVNSNLRPASQADQRGVAEGGRTQRRPSARLLRTAAGVDAQIHQQRGKLADIVRDLVAVMRRDIKTDWMQRDDVKATLRSQVKRLLVRHGYPPDQSPVAIKLVLEHGDDRPRNGGMSRQGEGRR